MLPALDKYIAELLYDYDCVVVPQLGGFVTNYRPAVIDTKKGLASPPGKDIRFNRNLTKNDGLLASACADANGWTFEEAGAFVHREVEGYLTQLRGGSKLKLNKVGILYFDAHKNLRFEPDTTHNFLKHSWGFETFALPAALAANTVAAPAPAPKPATTATEPKVIPLPAAKAPLPAREEPVEDVAYGKSEHTRSMYWVAAATLLPFMAMSLYIGMQTGFKSPADLSPADLMPFNRKAATQRMYHPVQGQSIAQPDGEVLATTAFPEGSAVFPFSFTNQRVDSTGVWINLAKVEHTAKSSAAVAKGGTYHIIAGCFADKANAEKLIRQLGDAGRQAYIIDHHKGLHRVAVQSFERYAAGLEALATARTQPLLEGAWMLKKPMK